jgi:hypothetical protein
MPDPGTTPTDDPTIANDAPLWRRIPPFHFVNDENRGRIRPSTAAFEDHPNGTPMSVVLGQEVLDAGRSPMSVLAGHDGYGMVTFSAGLARSKRQGVLRKPLPEEPAHAEVVGKKTDSVKKAFARESTWIVPPEAA